MPPHEQKEKKIMKTDANLTISIGSIVCGVILKWLQGYLVINIHYGKQCDGWI